MSSLAARRFAFDTVFDEAGAVAFSPAPTRRTLTVEDIERVRAEGFAAGERSAAVRAAETHAQALQQLSGLIAAALPTLAEVAHQHRRGAAELALAAARRIADAALDRFPEAPLTAALAALSAEVEAAPKLTVSLAAADVEALRPSIEHAAATAGFAGRLLLDAAPDGARAAFSFDWGDGRASFDPDQAAARVAEALEAALAAEGLHAEPLAASAAEDL